MAVIPLKVITSGSTNQFGVSDELGVLGVDARVAGPLTIGSTVATSLVVNGAAVTQVSVGVGGGTVLNIPSDSAFNVTAGNDGTAGSQVNLVAGDGVSGAGGTVFVTAGAGAGAGNGGGINLAAGLALTGSPGSVVASAGSTLAGTQPGGNIQLSGGASVGGAGGPVTLTGGLTTAGASAAGAVSLTGGSNNGVYSADFGSSLAFSSPTVTLTRATGTWTGADVGRTIRISGAAAPGNNGDFVILTNPAGNQVTWDNLAGGASEPGYAGYWEVLGTGDAGNVTLTGGGTTRLGNGGGVLLTGGTSTHGSGGVVTLTAGIGGLAGYGGDVTLTAGETISEANDGGNVIVLGGHASNAVEAYGGMVQIYAGDQTNLAAAGSGGAVDIRGGVASLVGSGGPVTVSAGSGAIGGDVGLVGGGGAAGPGGAINLTGGDGGSLTGNGGAVNLTGGQAISGLAPSGTINLAGGANNGYYTSGTGGIASLAGTTTLTSDTGTPFTFASVGRRIRVTGATDPANNGDFVILTVDGGGTWVTYANASAGADQASWAPWYVLSQGLAGSVNIQGGQHFADGNGGDAALIGGDSLYKDGGGVAVFGGGGGNAGGGVSVQAGSGTVQGGTTWVTSGSGQTGGVLYAVAGGGSTPGYVEVRGGAATGDVVNGGAISLLGGTAMGQFATGPVGSMAVVGTTVTLTDMTAAWTGADVGRKIKIQYSNPLHDGTFTITAQGGTTVTYTNPASPPSGTPGGSWIVLGQGYGGNVNLYAGESTMDGQGGSVVLTGGNSLNNTPGATTITTPRSADTSAVTAGPALTLIQSGASGATTGLFSGTADPTASGGIAANAGSLYLRSAGELWVKTAGTWVKAATGGASNLQDTYVAGNTISVTDAEGIVALTAAAASTVSVLSVTSAASSTQAALLVNGLATGAGGNALQVQNKGADVLRIDQNGNFVVAGTAGTGAANGSYVQIAGGTGYTGITDTGAGGEVSLQGGSTLLGTWGGAVRITGGSQIGGTGTGTGGNITITGGNTGNTGLPGGITIDSPRNATTNLGSRVGPALTLSQSGTGGTTIHVFAGSADPRTGSGIVANAGSLFHRIVSSTTGELYLKTTQGTATAWSPLSIPTTVPVTAFTTSTATIGQVVKVTAADTLAAAFATSGEISTIGIQINSVTPYQVVCSGRVTGLLDDLGAALTPGARYYLSETVAGKITSTPPVLPGSLVRRIGWADSASSLIVAIGEGTVLS